MIVTLAVGGCVEGPAQGGSGGGSSGGQASLAAVSTGKTAEERALETQVRNLNQVTRDIIVSNTLQGAIGGAVAGCVVANVSGRECKDGAIAGGIAGGIFGAVVGTQAAEAKRDLVRADQTLARLRNVSQQLAGVEANLRAVVNRQNSEIASLRRRVAAGQVSASQARARVNAINANRTAVIRGLDASRENVEKEGVALARLERESGQSQAQVRRAVASTSDRIGRLRNSVRLASTS